MIYNRWVVDLQTDMDQNVGHCRNAYGRLGAVAAAHPLAVQAGLEVLSLGGSAVDAALAAQAVICVAMPNAAGLGGDLLALIRTPTEVTAVGGTGLSPRLLPPKGFGVSGGASVTVPGLVDGWLEAHARWGQLDLPRVLAPAIGLARGGVRVDAELAAAVAQQRSRLLTGGAANWALLRMTPGEVWAQPELADLLENIGLRGRESFYGGSVSEALRSAVQRCGGSLAEHDLGSHRTLISEPISVSWRGQTVSVQPPPTQGVLLAMILAELERRTSLDYQVQSDAHLLIELTKAAFEHRSDSGLGARLLEKQLIVDPTKASRRSGPRAYLHTAGVATADANGMVVSSLISVFDDFGSAVFVPQAGIVLNNRAAGFTNGANAPAPARRPVHTLAPALIDFGDGTVLALATPGADGQIQTLLQVLSMLSNEPGETVLSRLAAALAAPRWRSEDGALLMEAGHPETGPLRQRGHQVRERTPGEDVFGAVVAAGVDPAARPFAAADWRRNASSGAA
jgi:gamma-glutamyltranspeptidase/glutathione hydrolase